MNSELPFLLPICQMRNWESENNSLSTPFTIPLIPIPPKYLLNRNCDSSESESCHLYFECVSLSRSQIAVKSSSRDEMFSEILLRECDSRVFTFSGVTCGGDLTREPRGDARHRFGRREEEGLLATPSTGSRASEGRWLGNLR